MDESINENQIIETIVNTEIDTHQKEEDLISDEKIEGDIKPTVRKLSLFDTLESKDEVVQDTLLTKSEPVFHQKKDEPEISIEESNLSEEFSGEENDLNDEYNQETEEELLDIPTFLRRQAN